MTTYLDTDHVLSPNEWVALWQPIDPCSLDNARLGLDSYARKVAAHWQANPMHPHDTSNRRYEVYLERKLSQGRHVPAEYVDYVTADDLQFRDCPLVEKAKGIR